MGGLFGTISKQDCVTDLFYGTDYNSHLGTRRGGMAVHDGESFNRAIHNLENNYFRTKFEPELPQFKGNGGIGVISDTEPQPLLIHSHLGSYAIVTVGRIVNMEALTRRALGRHLHFSETSGSAVSMTEMVAMLINESDTFVTGIENVFHHLKGSCTLLILTDRGIFAARDKLGRTPLILGRKEGAFALSSETTSFANMGFTVEKYLGPGEILFVTADGYEQIRKPGDRMQICTFLWVYYGYPSSYYEDINVEECRYR